MTFELDSFIPYLLSVAAARTSQRFAELYAAEAGISIPEWRVLAHLNGTGSVSIRDIDRRVNMEKSKVSRAASRLEEAGLVSKTINANDRRLISLVLTDEGRAMMQRIEPLARNFQKQILEELGADASVFTSGLLKLIGNPEEEEEGADRHDSAA